MSLKTTARIYLRDALTAFDRAPAEVALAVLSAVLFSYTLELEGPFQAWVQVAVGLFIAFAFAWTATLLHGMRAIDSRRRWTITVIGALGAVLYITVIKDIDEGSETWRAFMLVSGVVLLVLAAPAWMRSEQSASLRLRRINGRFLLRALAIGLYGLALFGGLALALAAITKLFELKLQSNIYGHVFGWIMLVLVPWVIVGGLESYLEPLDRVSDVARVVHRLASFLVPPLLVLYYGILFVYAFRIVLTGELPKNLVSPMVLAAGLLTALAAVLFDPLPEDQRTGHRILRVAPLLFVPLVPLGLWALVMRIEEYGWTEFRLLRVVGLALLLLLAIFGALQFVRRRPFSLRAIPLLLGGALLLAALGPWSVLAIARRDQQGRLAAALREAEVDVRRPVVAGDTTRRVIPRPLFDRINNTAGYLQSHFGVDAVAAVTGVEASRAPRAWSIADYFKLAPAFLDSLPTVVNGSLAVGAPVRLGETVVYRVATPSPQVILQGTDARLMFGGLVLRADLDTLLVYLPGLRRRDQRPLPAITVPVYDATQRKRGDLVVTEAMVVQRRDSVRFDRLDGILILR
jgi:hypothetical protein